ncbi:MAG: hypothetical protein ACREL5_09750 [Gemmatimonadales bacterium]
MTPPATQARMLMTRMIRIVAAVAVEVVVAAHSPLAAQSLPCCSITGIATRTGVVSAKVKSTGAAFTFKVNDARTVSSLKIGQAVYANFTTHQVSLDGRRACCTVASGPTTAPVTARTPAVVGAMIIPHIVSFSVDPVVTGGRELHGTVVIDPPASNQPQSMPRITLSTSSPQLVQLPPARAVAIQAGTSEAHFALLTAPVSSRTAVRVSASLNAATRSDTATIVPAALLGITVSPTTIGGGDTARVTVSFTGPPASGSSIVAAISSSNPGIVRVPATASLAADHTVLQFDAIGAGAGESTPVIIKATYGTSRTGAPRSTTAVLTVSPVPVTAGGRCYSPCLPVASIVAKLPVAAPSGGIKVFFSSPDLAFPQGDAITIPAGVDSGSIVASIEGRQVTGFPAATLPVDVSYNGHLFHGAGLVVWPEGKPDLAVWKVVLTDRYANDITASGPTDGEPFTMCAEVSQVGSHPDDSYDVWLTEPASPSQLRVSYLDNHGIGHEFNVTTDFNLSSSSYAYVTPVCATLPGLANVNDYFTLSLTADATNQVKEKDEGNNGRQLRITRKH